jgi:hypothetical protein
MIMKASIWRADRQEHWGAEAPLGQLLGAVEIKAYWRGWRCMLAAGA